MGYITFISINHKQKQADNNNYCMYILIISQAEKYDLISLQITLIKRITNFQIPAPTH